MNEKYYVYQIMKNNQKINFEPKNQIIISINKKNF